MLIRNLRFYRSRSASYSHIAARHEFAFPCQCVRDNGREVVEARPPV
jgi:hypothetical protein